MWGVLPHHHHSPPTWAYKKNTRLTTHSTNQHHNTPANHLTSIHHHNQSILTKPNPPPTSKIQTSRPHPLGEISTHLDKALTAMRAPAFPIAGILEVKDGSQIL